METVDRRLSGLFGCALLALLAPVGAAQQLAAAVRQGDWIPGFGHVVAFEAVTVTDDGAWLALVRTDEPDPAHDRVLLRSSGALWRAGDGLAEPVGASADQLLGMSLDGAGRAALRFALGGTAGAHDDRSVHFHTLQSLALLVQEDDACAAPELGAGARYLDLYEAALGDGNRLALAARVDDPARPAPDERALLVLDLHPSGAVLAESARAVEGDVLPGQVQPIAGFPAGPRAFATGPSGELLFAATLAGDPASDGVVYLDGTRLAQEGAPSPVAGRAWSSLVETRVALGVSGAVAFTGQLAGDPASDELLVRDGAKLVQEGDTLPAIAPATITAFGDGGPWVGVGGEVLWSGVWTEAGGAPRSGLFVDGELLIAAGATRVGDRTLAELDDGPGGYALSRDGRWVLFHGRLDDGSAGAWLVDRAAPRVEPYCFGDGSGAPCPCANEGAAPAGCANSTGAGAALALSGTTSVALDELTVAASGLPPHQGAWLFAGTQALGGGAGLPFHDGLRCAGFASVGLGLTAADAGGLASFGPGLAARAGFAPGETRYLQAWYRDPSGGPCGAGSNTTSAWRATFAP